MRKPFFFENSEAIALKVGDHVLADSVYGVEEVVQIDHFTTSYGLALHLGLKRPPRGYDAGGLRFACRFGFEPVVRVLLIERDELVRIQAEAEALA